MEREFINTKRWIQILVVLILCLVISLVSIKQPRAGNVTYIYDQIHRVIRATYDDGTIIAFTYDRVGNRLVKNVLSNPTLVTMLSPNGGDFAPSGFMHTVQWVAPPQAVKFKLQLSQDAGTSWSLIENNIPDQWYHWQVPITTNNSKECYVRVTGYNASGGTVGTDRSDSVFTIQVVGVGAPNGGETLSSGSVYPIRWATNKTNGTVATVRLEYTINGGTTWPLIKVLPEQPGDPINPGIYNWTVPTVSNPKYQCKVKVILKKASGTVVGSDTSDSYFTILP
jgi:YD repeat-containing protein